MNNTEYYSNRDIDAVIMSRILKWGRDISTDEATMQINNLNDRIKDGIRNYKDVSHLERERGDYLLLLNYRAHWNEYCFDDCSHWVGKTQ